MRTIIIQLDRYISHNIENYRYINRENCYSNLPITIRKQPHQSPDFNSLDLGYFNNIQGMKYKK